MNKNPTARFHFFLKSLLLLLPVAVFAQASNTDDDLNDVEEIIVTGSNIRGTPIDSPSPVQVLRREDLEAQGSPTVTEIVRNLGISNGNLGETNQFQANAAEGFSSVNIRGLGPERSLILLNGRRLAYAGYGFGNFTNLNSLPSIAIERLEVLKEGAATTYGSDAVAGVGNVLTRSKFTGVEATFNRGLIDGSDGDTQLGVIWGAEYQQGGNIVVSFGLQQRTELPVSERRDWSYLDATASAAQGWSSIGNPGTFFGAGSYGCIINPAACAPTNPLRESPSAIARALGTGAVVTDPACGEGRLSETSASLGGFCRFRYTPFDNLIEEESHWQMFADWTHEFSDTATLHVDFLIHESEVPSWNTSPSYPPQALLGAVQYVFPDHPGYQDMQQHEARLGTAGGFFWGRIVGAAGPEEEGEREISTQRLNAVYDFQVGDYDMQVGLTQGSSEGYLLGRDASIHRTGLAFRGLGGPNCPVRVDEAGSALTVGEVGGLAEGTLLYTGVTGASFGAALAPTGNGTDTDTMAALAAFRAAAGDDCEYYNPFSNAIRGTEFYNADHANSSALLNWMVQDLETTRTTGLLQMDYTIQGDIREFSGGMAGFAAGVQIRQNSFELVPNSITDLTLNPCPNPGDRDCPAPTGLFSFLSGATPLDVSQSVTALFAEAALPLQDNLDVQVAVRFEDVDGVSSFDPKASVRWEFIDNLTFRGSLGTTFRGPTPSQSDTGSRVTVLAFIAPTGAFKAVDIIGNDNLDPESAQTTNLGLVWTPNDRAELVADYWSFDFTDPIVNENQDQLVAAYSAGGTAQAAVNSQIFCSDGLCDGAPISGVQRIVSNWVNGADITTSGLDLSFRYTFDVGAGTLTAGISQNTVLEYDVEAYVKNGATVAAAYEALGHLNQNNPSPPLPESRMRIWADYGINNHKVLFYLNSIGGYEDQRNDGVPAASRPVPAELESIDAHQTFDLHYHYTFSGGNGTISGSMLNLADEAPPSAALDLGYDPFTHNAFGRIIKLGVRYKFF